MLKDDAIAHYGTQQKLAEALGIGQRSISGWGVLVPLDRAFILERLNPRTSKLRVRLRMYPQCPPRFRG